MSGRSSALAALALATGLASAPAQAQQVTSQGPLGQVDVWGEGVLSKADGPLPVTIWSNTDAETLKPLFALKATGLSPAARHALKRVIGSSSKPPKAGEPLIPDRLRLLAEIGETDAAVAIRRKFPATEWGKLGDAQLSEFELVAGRSETACKRADGKRADDPAWLRIRMLCFAAAGDLNAASMVSEQALSGDNGADAWVVSAIEYLRAPTRTKPAGRYGTPFETALSVTAKLPAAPEAFRATPPDIAEAVLKHPGATVEQRRAALRAAAEGGLVTPADALLVLSLPTESAGPAPQAAPQGQTQIQAQRAASRPRNDFLTLALEAAAKPDLDPGSKSTAYAVALKSAETIQEFRITALALVPELKALPKSDATNANAETFARAALVAGEPALAAEWRAAMDKLPKEKADAWAAARLDVMLSFAAADKTKAASQLEKLIAATPPALEAAAKAASPDQRQADLRRIETTRVLFLYAGAGRPLSPAARTLLSAQRTAGRGVSDAALARIQSALDADADGEAALAAIALLGNDPSAISFAGLSDILTFLGRAGLARDADAIALEALQPWKAL